MGGPGCFNLGSRFDLAANRIMDSTIGREAIAPPGSENLGHPTEETRKQGRSTGGGRCTMGEHAPAA